jgi:hypothetical protein
MKHGIESHFVRPDRVYATSVLTPVTGYEPVADAMQVAARFVGNGRGLAGPSASVALMGRKGGQAVRALFTNIGPRGRNLRGSVSLLGSTVSLLGSPFQGLRDWLSNLFATLRAKWESRKILKQLAPVTPTGVVSVDTSPRPTAASQAITRAGELPPAKDSPAIAAMRLMPALPAPYTSSSAIAAVIAPGATAMNQRLGNLWRWGN